MTKGPCFFTLSLRFSFSLFFSVLDQLKRGLEKRPPPAELADKGVVADTAPPAAAAPK
jgi:hypothetical protein